MGIIKNRWLTVVSTIMVLFVATACFQQVGDEAQGQAVSVVRETDTPIPPPPTSTPEITEEPTQTPTAADIGISNNPTDTPTATDTDVPTETATSFAVAQAGEATATDINDFSARATQLVIEATGTASAPLTQTAIAILGSTATPTATLVPVDNTGVNTTTNIQPGADCVHEVRAGETIYQYYLYYGAPVADIATRNGIVNANIISIGQRLVIPGCGVNGVLPPPTSVPTATATQFQFNSTLGQGGANLAGDASLGQGGGATTTTGLGCVTQYTVQQFDSLFQISVQYGVTAQAIANVNGILNVNRINMGDVLCIPAQ